MTDTEKTWALKLAHDALRHERIAVQNAEFGHEKAVYHNQALADAAMRKLEEFLDGLARAEG